MEPVGQFIIFVTIDCIYIVHEHDTEGKVLFIVTEDGNLRTFDVRNRIKVWMGSYLNINKYDIYSNQEW